MEQLIVTVSSDSGDNLLNCINSSHLRSNTVEINRSHRNLIELRLQKDTYNNNNEMLFTMEVAEVISRFIVNHMEALMIRRILFKRHVSYGDHELREIIQYCKQLIDDTNASLDSTECTHKHDRLMLIRDQLYSYLQSNSLLDVEGFMLFRLKKYINDLEDIVDDALDEFLLNEQYQEFIALLKYFVYFQDTKIPEVHLIHRGNNKFQLLDGDLKQLDLSDSKDVIFETVDRELNYEDMVVSALISASPKQIHIHTRESDTQSIKTIQQIFEGRTSICTCCQLCEKSLGEWKAERLT